MSVPVRKRSLSSLEFYNTAAMIYKDIVSILDKLPRKLVDPTNHEVDRTYLIDFYQKAFLKTYEDMMLNIDLANEIFISEKTTAQFRNKRLGYQDTAIAMCTHLETLVELLTMNFPKIIGELGVLSQNLEFELSLLKGWKEYTKKKRKVLD